MTASVDGTLFVYGTLMDVAERVRVLGREIAVTPASLDGFERGRSRYFYVIRKPGAKVEGAILRDLDAHDFASLDAYEDVPALYTREKTVVTGPGGGAIRCWIYLRTGWEQGR
jgi:gamma-glutamylcyclotransferase (GGCT)/AIG2-like uncharacterized protein YtfP